MNIFILRRDFRIIDNTALNKMPQNEPITLVFVLNPEQLNTKLNKYYSENCVRFMIESLQELNKSIENKIVFLKSDKDIFKQRKKFLLEIIHLKIDHFWQSSFSSF